jgi:SAM-dependent methyltransferase
MSPLLDRFKRTRFGQKLGDLRKFLRALTYRGRLSSERRIFAGQEQLHELPPIYHYWSNRYLRPWIEELGASDPTAFFVQELRSCAAADSEGPRFLSIGSGNCTTEIAIARALRAQGLERFELECVDINPTMLERGRAGALEHGVAEHLRFTRADFNKLRLERSYTGVMADQSLHHVTALEQLFDALARALRPGGRFVVHDMIGRNGHARWPEALVEVQRFWKELAPEQRFNHLTGRCDEEYPNTDYSRYGFEGIRAQDILPLLLERFHVDAFLPFANIVDPFIDRAYGPNFDVASARDRAFIDAVHARDEALIAAGTLTPTHMLAVLALERIDAPRLSRGLRPERCVRRSNRCQAPN